MIPIGREMRREMRRHDTYCSNFSCTPVTLAVGLRPGARRAIGLPSNRSRPVTNSAVPSGRHFLQLAGDPQNPDLESSIAIRKVRDAIKHCANGHSSIICAIYMCSDTRPGKSAHVAAKSTRAKTV